MKFTHARMGAATVVVVAGLVMAGCGSSDGSDSSTAATSSSSSPSGSTSPSATSSSTSSASDAKTIAPTGNADQKLTKPGASLKLNEPAYLEIVTGKKSSDYYSKAIVKVTVTEIRKGSTSDWSALKNAEKFKDYTPFYIESTNEIVYFEGNRYSKPSVSLDPIGKGRIGSIITFGSFEKCKSTSYPSDPDTAIVGSSSKPCDVAAGASGGVVTGAKYGGKDSSSDYYKSPVTWGSGS